MTLNGLPAALRHETVWLDAHKYMDAEKQYQEYLIKKSGHSTPATLKEKTISPVSIEIANAREKIKSMLTGDVEKSSCTMMSRIEELEKSNKIITEKLKAMSTKVETYDKLFDKIMTSLKNLKVEGLEKEITETLSKNAPAEDDDDIDLFGSDEETEEEARVKEERLKAYAAKKAKKPALAAKSSLVLDVKPWDDETDMKALEAAVRKIDSDGLKWGASKLVPLAYGIKKLQIIAIIEDDKISVDWLQETIQENEDLVQSVDIAAFNKL